MAHETVGPSLEVIERTSKPNGFPSKVRQILKKFAEGTSRVGLDNKSTWTLLSGHEERKNIEKLCASQDVVLATGLMKTASAAKHLKSSMVDNAPPLSSTVFSFMKPVVLVGGLQDGFFASFILGRGITIGAGLAFYSIDTVRRRMMMASPDDF